MNSIPQGYNKQHFLNWEQFVFISVFDVAMLITLVINVQYVKHVSANNGN